MSEPQTKPSHGLPTGLLSPLQVKVVAAAVTATAAAIMIWLGLTVLGAMRDFLVKFSGVIWPLAVAGILALLLKPVVIVLRRKFGLGKNAAIFLLFGLVLLVAAGFLAFFVPVAITQVGELARFLQETNFSAQFATLREKLPQFLQDALPKTTDSDLVGTILRNVGNSLKEVMEGSLATLKGTASWLGSAFAKVTAAAIVPVYLYHLLSSDFSPGQGLDRNLSFLPRRQRHDLIFLAREFVNIVVAFFRGQILIGLIMGLLLGTGFAAAGLKFGFFIGLGMGLLNVVPYLGSILGLCIALPLGFFQSGTWLLPAICLGVFAGVQILEGYVLTPKIMGKTTGLHPMAIIVAIFFWGTALDGLLGLILAIPLTAFVIVAWRLAREKYLNRLASVELAEAPCPTPDTPPSDKP